MAFTGKYILAAIDGTGSHEWRRTDGSNSHIYRFSQNLDRQGGSYAYWNGPGEDMGGTVFGRGATATVTGVVEWINRQAKNLVKLKTQAPFLRHRPKKKETLRRIYDEQLRICIVGHSRGGLIAICAAKQLLLPVYWMGLYDAVDMHPTLDADMIHNVDFTAHALRSPFIRSRDSWGNCGRRSSKMYVEKIFRTSHGGIGGDPVLAPQGIGADYSCMRGSLADNIATVMGQSISDNCIHQSVNANNWILTHARGRGLKV